MFFQVANPKLAQDDTVFNRSKPLDYEAFCSAAFNQKQVINYELDVATHGVSHCMNLPQDITLGSRSDQGIREIVYIWQTSTGKRLGTLTLPYILSSLLYVGNNVIVTVSTFEEFEFWSLADPANPIKLANAKLPEGHRLNRGITQISPCCQGHKTADKRRRIMV